MIPYTQKYRFGSLVRHCSHLVPTKHPFDKMGVWSEPWVVVGHRMGHSSHKIVILDS